MLQITPLPAFNDNYIWTLQTEQSTGVYVVDPGDAQVVIDYVTNKKLTLQGILITHHHHDHTGGIAALCAHFGKDIPVYGPQAENIQGISRPITAQATVTLEGLELEAKVIQVPGHTLGHIAYLIDNLLFCGDTLFSGGCGRLFEGTAEQMYQSLSQLSELPDDTKVYCTHEYTLANLRFACAAEPNNQKLQEYVQQANQLRAQNIPTLPSSIGLEKAINPFLRADCAEIQQILAVQFQQPITNTLQSFALLRQWKDNF
ncbi:hydroxyacylglutathione hydrolase [Shewanella sp. 1CM18E]|uniref:hydroxyacylglutathione hydrolase n=1 Tax=Shewanella sp. 1CM18E TaxID=2929169 RepID=UPI0020C05CDB|nr:hydroxyacylglutathione hydrolase [Shewanella sp. 1CM18E]MCK8045213.1 hydroxyacylglutathione hydrolase [Shewanella sp. 1CM18E]